ncbi:hypothetical protein WICPIJ_009731 [Wickerhamomyces pijperi]|uniref:Uncharacterized protein n=1 Tax=Wickerhamomyces pijperi TaxID=599730 RepID=A0A9P8PLI4_WICPI|nr:hypothetical protein WICPIJ_009731 [Wickerhamomyces pijperi]
MFGEGRIVEESLKSSFFMNLIPAPPEAAEVPPEVPAAATAECFFLQFKLCLLLLLAILPSSCSSSSSSGTSMIEGSSPIASSMTFDLGSFSLEKFGTGFFFSDLMSKVEFV